jgi:hypothetical protein
MATTDLNDQLLPGERIIWSGVPGQGLLLTGSDALMIPFSLVWAGFAIFWERTVLQQNGPFFFKLFGVPFVLIGLYLVVGRFFVDAWIRRGMQYAVTNKRMLISRSPPFGKLTAVSLDSLPEATLTERGNGRGTIRFGQPAQFWTRSGGYSSWTPSLDVTPQFLNIEDARSVFNQIQSQSRSVARSNN